ncbi:TIGR03013 family PEP-CTERM/XrtA system glycosyltransferase [Catenovulum sp. SM1970]|uniref:TIGR03013 family XrtA/PEP-CTERM system glycosyltransferase n=1 Tax=Marinifaba aquimaris TaxID=2741323 RepID=UPI001574BD52|nr:TIGR03013 family XrtA/PEP-CTERM system glycosyltransferase [Marinifaba aquimaris]NTS75957.1 TIGR03013 family PEP-CTERM/XrtA system glycosyltransferase [Marinifaba aquimaris]
MKSFKGADKNIKSRGLFLLDLLCLSIANCVVFFLVEFYQTDSTFINYNALFTNNVILTTVLTLTNLAVGLYDSKLRDTVRALFRRVFVSAALTFFLLELIVYPLSFIPGDAIYRAGTLPALILAIFVIFYVRYLTLTSKILGYAKKKVLVIGAGERASIIQKRMRRIVDRKNFELLGFFAIEGDKTDELTNENIINMGSIDNLVAFVTENDVDEIVIAPDERRNTLPVDLLFECKIRGVEIVDILDFMEEETGQIAVNLMYPSWVIYSNGFNSKNHLKETFDYLLNMFLALFIFMFTWPLMVFTVIAIYLEDGRKNKASVFYKQVRVGINGAPFSIYKFRSMRPDAEKNGAQWATQKDNRVTKVGAFIRKYRIDELPQLFNVFRGEMGFVGPRPERPEFVKELIKESPYYTHRHNVRPGLTGWAQLKYPYGASKEDSIEKLKFDLYYIKHRSIMLDLLILIRTVEIVLFGKGR